MIGARSPAQASAETEIFSMASLRFCRTSGRMRVTTIPSDVLSTRAVRVFRTKFIDRDHYLDFGEKFNPGDLLALAQCLGYIKRQENGVTRRSKTVNVNATF